MAERVFCPFLDPFGDIVRSTFEMPGFPEITSVTEADLILGKKKDQQ
jgi:hypothetical protein